MTAYAKVLDSLNDLARELRQQQITAERLAAGLSGKDSNRARVNAKHRRELAERIETIIQLKDDES